MNISAWRATLRIARRDALRAKGRSALIIAMIALPVVGVTATDVVNRSSRLTPQESITRLMGASDAYVSTVKAGWRLEQSPTPTGTTRVLSQSGPTPVPTTEEAARAAEPLEQLLKEALPPGAHVLPVDASLGYNMTSTVYGQGAVQTQSMDLSDPATHGIVTLRQGSWPGAAYEVAATTGFLSESGLHVGQSTTLAGTTQPLKITAAIEYPGLLRVARLVGRPGELSKLLASVDGNQGEQPPARGSQDFLVIMPGHAAFSWDEVQHANAYGFTVASRTVLADPPPAGAVPLFRSGSDSVAQADTAAVKSATIFATVVGMALLEVVLLAGPAFAVGARRSRRQLGLIAACGGNRAHIRRVVLGGGIVLGTTGALVGVVLGGLAVALGRSALETRSGARFGHFALEPGDLLAIVAIGLVTGLLAAVVPAVQAARQPVVAALTGRVTSRPPAIWLTVVGVLVALAGTALALLGAVDGSRTRVVMAGSMVAELGLVICTPWFVSLFGRIGRFLPLGPRLALRDAARNRGRSAPAVAAVLAAVAGAVAVLIFQTSSASAARSGYAPTAPNGAVVVEAYSALASSFASTKPGTSRATAAAAASAASAKNADALRSAVEHAIPGLGQRGDIREITYGPCDGTKDGFCGSVGLTVPKENLCPAAAGLTNLRPVGFVSPEEAKQLLAHDPRCKASVPTPLQVLELITGDATVLHNLLGVDDPAAAQALAAGQVVVLDPHFIKDGKVALALTRFGATGPSGNQVSSISLPAVEAKATTQAVRAVMSPETAKAAGLTLGYYDSVWLPAHAPSSAEEQGATAAVASAGRGKLSVERGYQNGSGSATMLGLVIAASAVAIAAAGIATGLAAADSQGDLATLAAVGAAPGIRRRLSGFQCAAVAAMGALVGVAAGFVPAVAVQRVQNLGARPHVDITGGIDLDVSPLVVPWTYLIVIVVGLPLLAWVLAAGFTRSRAALTRRTN
ncbi:ABC transporter permease [Kitasatospora sp. MAP5-34]|uniref:ABC transporter permease n=1 Tax=Kitasatospora sp. MAP5-34 TaxID=3035102 RepID=UPI00247379D5|nr:ABC transporter permease [Kitasatospora sp. MAP5-34]MDH6577431.1 putative ABC transport system permease protein [Kitasatospora sp. MAP5-34]